MSEIPFLIDFQLAIFSYTSLPLTQQEHKLFRNNVGNICYPPLAAPLVSGIILGTLQTLSQY